MNGGAAILAVAAVLAAFCGAAEPVAPSAGGDLAVARAALRDRLWEIARSHAMKADGDEARRIVLESFAREGKWSEVAAALKSWGSPSGGVFDYYAAAAAGDREKARRALLATGTDEGAVSARMVEADLLVDMGRRGEAEEIWRDVASSTNADERAFTVSCANLRDAALLRRAYAAAKSSDMRRLAGLGLGVALAASTNAADAAEGERIVRAFVKDSPDAPDTKEAFLALAEAAFSAGRWKDAGDIYRDAAEIWPDVVRSHKFQSGRGWVLLKLGRAEEAIGAFERAFDLAEDDASRAEALAKQGDALSEIGRAEEAMAKYKLAMGKYPDTEVARSLGRIVKLRELELAGLEHYRSYRFPEAQKAFAAVAAEDRSRAEQMEYFRALCLYAQGMDDEAAALARRLSSGAENPAIRADASLWLAKFSYNRGEWKDAYRLFGAYADSRQDSDKAPAALLWAARAAFAANDYVLAVQTVTRLAERYPSASERPAALIVQGESLIELARFDEAVLVLEIAALGEGVGAEERMRASVLKADALYAMGADNPARYQAALEAYRSVLFGGKLGPSAQISVSFKIARTLEKLKRADEAMDQYYTQVVLAYRDGRISGVRYDDDARAAFSRAAFRLADEYEGRGGDAQAVNILNLVAESDVPAAAEARNRIRRISAKGGFL